jgi:hypothetical protein
MSDVERTDPATNEGTDRPRGDVADTRADQPSGEVGDTRADQPSGEVGDNTRKDPDEWKTGDEPMTGAQRSYLKTLSDEGNVPFEENLTKAEASRRIDELQAKTGRGQTPDA